MKTFALTGGIATGKSTVSTYWRDESQLAIVDADAVAHQVLARGDVLDAIRSQFGDYVFVGSSLDRRALGKTVFADVDKKRELESITHPLIRKQVACEFAKLASDGHKLACYDVPLLFESNIENDYENVVVVTADPNVQLVRLMQRNSLSESDALKRIAAQLPMKQKVSRADYVIDNSTSLEDMKLQANIVLANLRDSVRK